MRITFLRADQWLARNGFGIGGEHRTQVGDGTCAAAWQYRSGQKQRRGSPLFPVRDSRCRAGELHCAEVRPTDAKVTPLRLTPPNHSR
jgi:hypothetical protein